MFTRYVLCLTVAVPPVGCSSPRRDESISGMFAIEKQPDEQGYYRDIQVRRLDGNLSVAGYVRRLYPPGQVRVQLLAHGREMIAEATAAVPRVPRYSHGRQAYFEVQVPDPLHQTTIVTLSHVRNTE